MIPPAGGECHYVDPPGFTPDPIALQGSYREEFSSLAEEYPEVYKDVSDVVEAVHGAGLARMVARLRPVVVIRG